MDNFARLLSISPDGEWTPEKHHRLYTLRELQRKHKVLLFLLHCTTVESADFDLGKLYQIQVFDNIDIVHAQSNKDVVAFSAHVMLERFTYVGPGDELTYSAGKSLPELLQSADRWNALMEAAPMIADRTAGFEDDLANHPNDEVTGHRCLSLDIATHELDVDGPVKPYQVEYAKSKLTELSDVVRAREIEKLHEKPYQR